MSHPFAGNRYQEATVDGLTVRLKRCTSATLLEQGKAGASFLLAILPRSGEDLAELAAIEMTSDPAVKQQRAFRLIQQKLQEAQRPEHIQARQERAEQLVAVGLVAIQTADLGWIDCRFVPGPAPAELPDTLPIPMYAELLPKGNQTVLALAEAILQASGGADLQKIERFRLRPRSPAHRDDRPCAREVDLGGAGAESGAAGHGAGGSPVSERAEGTAGEGGSDPRH